MRIAIQDVKLIQICVVTSVFSQMEVFSSVFRPLMYAAWLITIIYYILNNARNVVLQKYTKVYLLLYGMIIVLCILATLLGRDHLNGNYLRIMVIPLFVTVVGDFFGIDMSNDGLQKILKTYLVSAVIYALWVNITYYASYSNWLQQTMYAFMQKNSAAQIWSAGILIALLLINYKSRMEKIIGYSSAFYLVVVCGISQCRTALLALAVIVCLYVLLKSRHKLRWGMIIGLAGIAVWNLPFTRNFINQAFFLTKYAGADLNTFSSGRLGYWTRALEVFSKNMFFGVGQYYVDCSYLCVLAEIGLLGFILVEIIWFSRAILNFKVQNTYTRDFLFCMTIFYLVESVLEGYPPFGPGVSSFMFWFLSAAFTGRMKENLNTPAMEVKQ